MEEKEPASASIVAPEKALVICSTLQIYAMSILIKTIFSFFFYHPLIGGCSRCQGGIFHYVPFDILLLLFYFFFAVVVIFGFFLCLAGVDSISRRGLILAINKKES